jgi:hypothetical protein
MRSSSSRVQAASSSGRVRRRLPQAIGAAADGGGQFFDLVVGQDQPAQRGRQGGARHMADLVRLEADHAQGRALAQYGG